MTEEESMSRSEGNESRVAIVLFQDQEEAGLDSSLDLFNHLAIVSDA
jgi:hypothetical protein